MIFVTGGSGLVGSHLLLELAKEGKQIRALKRPTSDTGVIKKLSKWYHLDAEKLLQNITWVDGDLLDPISINTALEGVQEVYHCAATVSFNPGDRLKMIRNNVDGTSNLVNACLEHKINKFCHVSSVAAFGKSVDGGAVDEESMRDSQSGHSGYSTSKYWSELEVWRGHTEGLNTIIVNPSIILGPAPDWSKGSQRMFNAVANGMKFFTSGASGFVDVKDVVTIMIELMDKSIFGQRFCLNAENISYREVFSEIAQSLNRKPPHIEAKPWMLQILRFMETIISKFNGKEPRVSKESARSAFNQTSYSNKKIVDLLNYDFVPIKKTIHSTCKLFLKESEN